MTKLAQNFYLEEFGCHDGTPVPEEFMGNVQELAQNLQVLRDEIGTQIHLLSGYRTPSWNSKVGGKPNSFHMKAMAADITTATLSPRQLHGVIEKLIKLGRMKQGGLGLYSGFVHYDVRGEAARWFQ